jgi:hypothetical protein
MAERTPIDTLVIEIRGLLLDVTSAESKLNSKRLAAGPKLLELRHRIVAGEAGDISRWDYYDKHLSSFRRSRKDAEKLMRMAASDDPEATFETERVEAKERIQKHRAATKWDIGGTSVEVRKTEFVRHGANVRSTPKSPLLIDVTIAADEAVAAIEIVSKKAKEHPSLPQATVDYVVEAMLTAAKRAREVADEVRRDKRSHIQPVPTHEAPESEN